MTHYVCSCGALFGEHKDAFNQSCRIRGHTLFEVEDVLYCLIYEIQEANALLKKTLQKRNRNIAILKDRITVLTAELRVVKMP